MWKCTRKGPTNDFLKWREVEDEAPNPKIGKKHPYIALITISTVIALQPVEMSRCTLKLTTKEGIYTYIEMHNFVGKIDNLGRKRRGVPFKKTLLESGKMILKGLGMVKEK